LAKCGDKLKNLYRCIIQENIPQVNPFKTALVILYGVDNGRNCFGNDNSVIDRTVIGVGNMAFILTVAFIVICISLPTAIMWSAGAFVGQRPAPQWAAMVIRYSVSACLFATCSVAAIVIFTKFRVEWWSIPACAIICGAGISGIIGVNTYKGG
jgi:hypothetical protein